MKYFQKITCFVGMILMFLLIALDADAQKAAYQLYDKEGKKVDYDKLLKQASKNDVILFGELHNNPICHWLQFELTKDLHSIKNDDLVLAAEMFEADNQLILNEYLQGLISERNFEAEAKLWNNYKTDYKPLVDFAKEHNIAFVASNVPRRYANMVYKSGFEALEPLDEIAKSYIAPLPIAYDRELKSYQQMLEMAGGHGGENLPKAQAIKDATMAFFIFKACTKKSTLIHFNGSYHSEQFEGINWYLVQSDKKIKVLTIASVDQENIEKLESDNLKLADFILVIPSSMTKTH